MTDDTNKKTRVINWLNQPYAPKMPNGLVLLLVVTCVLWGFLIGKVL